jgi:hypothetical protein
MSQLLNNFAAEIHRRNIEQLRGMAINDQPKTVASELIEGLEEYRDSLNGLTVEEKRVLDKLRLYYGDTTVNIGKKIWHFSHKLNEYDSEYRITIFSKKEESKCESVIMKTLNEALRCVFEVIPKDF